MRQPGQAQDGAEHTGPPKEWAAGGPGVAMSGTPVSKSVVIRLEPHVAA